MFLPFNVLIEGILGVCGIGVNLDRAADTLPAVKIRFVKEN